MRGKDEVWGSLYSYVDLEQLIRPDHPFRPSRAIVNAALAEMSAEFGALYPPTGRDSIPPYDVRGAMSKVADGYAEDNPKRSKQLADFIFELDACPDEDLAGSRPGTNLVAPATLDPNRLAPNGSDNGREAGCIITVGLVPPHLKRGMHVTCVQAGNWQITLMQFIPELNPRRYQPFACTSPLPHPIQHEACTSVLLTRSRAVS